MRYFKIFDEKDGQPRTLFHGVGGSRTLPLDTWIEAVVKDVSDGGTVYKSGFHVLADLDETLAYATRFKQVKIVAEVDVDEEAGTWPKSHSPSNIILAKKIRIRKSQWRKRMRSDQEEK